MTQAQKQHRRENLIRARAIQIKRTNETFWERFWSHVDKFGDGGCWNWTGSVNTDGYGQVKRYGVAVMVHRTAFEYLKGPIPKGLQLLHSCDNPACVNPDHLSPGTARDNILDAMKKGRRFYRYGATHHNARFTTRQVRQMRKWFETGKRTCKELSKYFRANPNYLRLILTGKRWAWLK